MALCHQADLGIWVIDLLTEQSFWSGQVNRLLQLQPPQDPPVGGFHLSTLPDHCRLLGTDPASIKAVFSGTHAHQDLTVTGQNGFLRKLRLTCLSEPANRHKPTQRICFIQDVTESLRLQQTVVHLGKLEFLGQMTGALVHETNNMLGIITGYLSTIGTATAVTAVDDRLAIEHSLAAAGRAADLMGSLLSLARHKAPLPAASLCIDDILTKLKPTIELMVGRAVQCDFMLTAGTAEAQIDRSLFESCLLNLVANARDAMPHGGHLRLHTSAQRSGSPAFLEIAVTDTGSGMDEETVKRCLEPFFTTKPEGQGTGLGLPLVNQLVSRNGGRLAIDSELGLGTTLRIYLPLAAPRSDVQPQTGQIAQKRLNILFVDDEAALRALGQRVLRGKGHTVVCAESASEARRHLAQSSFDLLVVDINLEGLEDGLSLSRFVQVQHPSLRVIVMSGGDNDTRMPGGDSTVVFLPKPFRTDTLLQAVERL
jgi:hypothetical protein